jgi:hypothetical protein
MTYVIADEEVMIRQRRTVITSAFSKNAWQVVTAAHRPAEDTAFREVTKTTMLSKEIQFNLNGWQYEVNASVREPHMNDFLWRVYLTELEVMRRGSRQPMKDVAEREYLRVGEAKALLDWISLVMTLRDLLKLDPVPPVPSGYKARYKRIKSGMVNFEVLSRHATTKKKAA